MYDFGFEIKMITVRIIRNHVIFDFIQKISEPYECIKCKWRGIARLERNLGLLLLQERTSALG